MVESAFNKVVRIDYKYFCGSQQQSIWVLISELLIISQLTITWKQSIRNIHSFNPIQDGGGQKSSLPVLPL